MTSKKKMKRIEAAHENGAAIEMKARLFDDEWGINTRPMWNWAECKYRVKKPEPGPCIPLECWANDYGRSNGIVAWGSPEQAVAAAGSGVIRKAVHMREVLPHPGHREIIEGVN